MNTEFFKTPHNSHQAHIQQPPMAALLDAEDRALLKAMAEAQLRFKPDQTLAFVLAATDVIDAADGRCLLGQIAVGNILRELGVVVPTGRWFYPWLSSEKTQ